MCIEIGFMSNVEVCFGSVRGWRVVWFSIVSMVMFLLLMVRLMVTCVVMCLYR